MKYSCEFTQDKQDLDHYFQLRQDIFQQRLGLKIPKKDQWDEMSHICVIKEDGIVIGGSRLTESTQGLLLPMEEEAFKLENLLDSQLANSSYAELSKLIIHHEHCAKQLSMMQYLALEQKSLELGLNFVYSITPKVQAKLYMRSFKQYQQNHCRSEFKIIPDIEIDAHVKEKYNGLSECLTQVTLH